MPTDPTEQTKEPEVNEERCTSYHGIDPDRWTIDPHPLSACAELIEMGKVPTPTFLQAMMADGSDA